MITGSTTIEPETRDNFRRASFKIRLEKHRPVRYVLTLLPGYNESGEHLADQPEWMDLARRTNGAILGCTFKSRPKEDSSIHYAAARYGSGKALDLAVKRFSEQFPGLMAEELPLFIYGHSAGGQFAYGYSCFHPERLIGFASVKGGIYFPEPVSATYGVPGLLISGEKDLPRRRHAIRKLFEDHREHGAPWCWMEERKAGHEPGKSASVVIPWCEDMVRLRLKADDSSLKPLDQHSGLWVDLKTGSLVDSTTGSDPGTTGWLPSPWVYETWKALDNGLDKFK